MLVRCVDNEGIGSYVRLTLNKIYNVTETGDGGFDVIDDSGDMKYYYRFRFEKIRRKEKLESILKK